MTETSAELIPARLRELAERLQPDCKACIFHGVRDDVVLLMREAEARGVFSDPRFISLRKTLSEKGAFSGLALCLDHEHGGLPPMPEGWGWRIDPNVKKYAQAVILALATLLDKQSKPPSATENHRRRANWKVVRDALESLADQGRLCPTYRDLQSRMETQFGSCSLPTVKKAFDDSEKLREWKARKVIIRQTRREAIDVTPVMGDSELHEAMARIIELTPEDQRPRLQEDLEGCDLQKLAEILSLFDPLFANTL